MKEVFFNEDGSLKINEIIMSQPSFVKIMEDGVVTADELERGGFRELGVPHLGFPNPLERRERIVYGVHIGFQTLLRIGKLLVEEKLLLIGDYLLLFQLIEHKDIA